MEKSKRGPKPLPDGERKVMAKLWVKKKFLQLAEIDLAKLQLKFDNEILMTNELKKYKKAARN